MMMIVFHVGVDSYAIDSQHIAEIIPAISFEKIPQAPNFVAGLINLHNSSVPVIDFTSLISGHPCEICLHTRIMILSDPDKSRYLGLMAEKVVEVVDVKSMIDNQGFIIKNVPYLGEVLNRRGQMIQVVKVPELFELVKDL